MLVTVTSASTGSPAVTARREREPAVLECRIAESVAEGPQRLAFEVAVGPVRHRVVLEVGQLVHVLVERHGQPACGIVFAAQGLGDRRAAFFAGVPGFQNRVRMRVYPVDRQCAAVHQDHSERLSGSRHGFDQILLRLGQVDAGPIATKEAGLLTGISSPSSWLVMPTAAITTSAVLRSRDRLRIEARR